MKKFFSLLLLVIILLTLSNNIFAENINLSTEINSILDYYSKTTKSIDSFETIVAIYSVNSRVGTFKEDIIFDKNKDYAGLILSRLATNNDPTSDFHGINPVEALIGQQDENGSFGTFNNHFFAIVALESVKALKGPASVTYADSNALNYLLSLKKTDGSFGDAEKTAKAIIILNKFSQDSKASAAMQAACEYLRNTEFTQLKDICYKVLGLTACGDSSTTNELIEKIISFKNDDGSYPEDLTITVLLTFDSVLNENTAYGRLMAKGSFSEYTLESAKPFLLAVGILVLLSIGFWIYIMTTKKLKKRPEKNESQNMEDPPQIQ